MADYSKDIASARKDIIAAGIMCQLDRTIGGAVDCPFLFTQVQSFVIDGELVRVTDHMGIAPGDIRLPDVEQDRLIIPACFEFPSGMSLRLVRALPVSPSGQPIIWEMLLRR